MLNRQNATTIPEAPAHRQPRRKRSTPLLGPVVAVAVLTWTITTLAQEAEAPDWSLVGVWAQDGDSCNGSDIWAIFLPGGSVTYLNQNRVYSGTWTVENDLMSMTVAVNMQYDNREHRWSRFERDGLDGYTATVVLSDHGHLTVVTKDEPDVEFSRCGSVAPGSL